MKTRSHSKPSRRTGFTLIELLVAMSISTIIVAVLVTITGVATDTWTRSRTEIRAARQAKTLLDTMAKDFESMVSRSGNNFEWLYSEIDSGAQLPRVAKGQGRGGDVAELTFFTAATDRYLGQIGGQNDEGGDVSCVSYRLRFQDPIDGGDDEDTSTFVVYRKLVNPDETFDQLLGQTDLDSAFGSFANEVTDEENFVCENVFLFTVTYLVEVSTGNGSRQIVRVPLDSSNSSGRFSLTGEGIDTNISAEGASDDEIAAGRLTGVELSISVISDAGIVRVNASEDGLSEEDYARQVYHYSRVVDVPSM